MQTILIANFIIYHFICNLIVKFWWPQMNQLVFQTVNRTVLVYLCGTKVQSHLLTWKILMMTFCKDRVILNSCSVVITNMFYMFLVNILWNRIHLSHLMHFNCKIRFFIWRASSEELSSFTFFEFIPLASACLLTMICLFSATEKFY